MSEHLTKANINTMLEFYKRKPRGISLGEFLQRGSKKQLEKIEKKGALKKPKPVGSVISQNNMQMLKNIYKENYNKKRTDATLNTYLRPIFFLHPKVLTQRLKKYDKNRNNYSFPEFVMVPRRNRSPLSTIQISR